MAQLQSAIDCMAFAWRVGPGTRATAVCLSVDATRIKANASLGSLGACFAVKAHLANLFGGETTQRRRQRLLPTALWIANKSISNVAPCPRIRAGKYAGFRLANPLSGINS